MPTRTPALAALAAGAVALAAPAAASAATRVSPATTTVVAGPVKVKAYSMTVTTADDTLTVLLTRKAGHSTQTHSYAIGSTPHHRIKGMEIKIAHSLGSGTIKAPLGRYGEVNLKLHASGPSRTAKVPKGCTGPAGRSRAGKLTGTFALKADRGRYFGTIHEHSLPARAVRTGRLKCKIQTPSGDPDLRLDHAVADASGPTQLEVESRNGRVTETVTDFDSPARTAPLFINDTITALAPISAFTVANDLSSASVTGAGRFLTGSLAFKADNDPLGSVGDGTATGNLTAKFDTRGPLSLTAGPYPTHLYSSH